MSNRERWIVYPLLFLALISSISDKIVPPTTAKFASLTCGELTVVTAKRKPVLVLRPDASDAGEVLLYQDRDDPYLRMGLDEHQQGATLEGWSLNHQTHFRLQAHPSGAMAEWTRNNDNRVLAGFSPYGPQAGLWGLDLHDQPKVNGPTTEPVAGTWGVLWPEPQPPTTAPAPDPNSSSDRSATDARPAEASSVNPSDNASPSATPGQANQAGQANESGQANKPGEANEAGQTSQDAANVTESDRSVPPVGSPASSPPGGPSSESSPSPPNADDK